MAKKTILHTSTLEEERDINTDYYKFQQSLDDFQYNAIQYILNNMNKRVINIMTDKWQKIEEIRDSFDIVLNSWNFISKKDWTRLIRYLKWSDDFWKELFKYIEKQSNIWKWKIIIEFLLSIVLHWISYIKWQENAITWYWKWFKELWEKILDYENQTITPEFKDTLIKYVELKTLK